MRSATRLGLGLLPVMVTVAGCGSAGSPAASRAAPAAPQIVSAFVGAHVVRLAPDRLGGGPVLLIVVDRARGPIGLALTRTGHPGAVTAGPRVAADGVAQMTVDLPPGTYRVRVRGLGARTDADRARSGARTITTTLHVGASRASAGNQVLLP